MSNEAKRANLMAHARQFLGMKNGDPKFDEANVVSRGPGANKDIGWCGDFVTFAYYSMGCNDCSALNRYDLCGSWLPGDNIPRLDKWAKAHGAYINIYDAKPGDVIQIPRADGDHVGLIRATPVKGGTLVVQTLDGNSWGHVVAENNRTAPTIRCVISMEKLLDAMPGGKDTPDPNGGFPFPFPIPGMGGDGQSLPGWETIFGGSNPTQALPGGFSSILSSLGGGSSPVPNMEMMANYLLGGFASTPQRDAPRFPGEQLVSDVLSILGNSSHWDNPQDVLLNEVKLIQSGAIDQIEKWLGYSIRFGDVQSTNEEF